MLSLHFKFINVYFGMHRSSAFCSVRNSCVPNEKALHPLRHHKARIRTETQRLHVFDSTDSFGGTMDKKTKKQKEKIKHRAINWKLVSEFCRGTAWHFILGTLGIVFAALSAYCIPLITSFTIDYVLIGYADEAVIIGLKTLRLKKC